MRGSESETPARLELPRGAYAVVNTGLLAGRRTEQHVSTNDELAPTLRDGSALMQQPMGEREDVRARPALCPWHHVRDDAARRAIDGCRAVGEGRGNPHRTERATLMARRSQTPSKAKGCQIHMSVRLQ